MYDKTYLDELIEDAHRSVEKLESYCNQLERENQELEIKETKLETVQSLNKDLEKENLKLKRALGLIKEHDEWWVDDWVDKCLEQAEKELE
jgi:cell shape-determining protein MreC